MMFWQFRKLTYDILIPPLGKSIYQLSEQEVADYFAWFQEKIPERVAYVSKVCATELRIPVERLDCSPESLMLLWKWFRRRAKQSRQSTQMRKQENPKHRTNFLPTNGS